MSVELANFTTTTPETYAEKLDLRIRNTLGSLRKSLFERNQALVFLVEVKIESKSLTSPAKTCRSYGRNTFTLQSRNHSFGIFTSFILEGKNIRIKLKAIGKV
jgi:hypothetical protein